MFLKSHILALATVLVCVITCEALKCTGGTQDMSDDRCVLFCSEKDKCLCAKDDNPSNKTGCLQRCDLHPMGNKNITIKKCLDMECSNLDDCFQVCGNDECKMQCKSTKTCIQECPGYCSKLVCSGPECNQQCKNCTMECTSDVKTCTQQCLGGTCYSVCAAKECHKSCSTSPGEKCEIKIISSGERLSAMPLVKFMILMVFLVKLIY